MGNTTSFLTQTRFHPTQQQAVLMDELVQSTYQTYCFVLDGLASHRWNIDAQNMLKVVDTAILNDWIDNRPVGLCPMVMMKYIHREACHNWFDNGCDERVLACLKDQHSNQFFMPASGHYIHDGPSLYISGVGYISIDPVELPGRMHLIIGQRIDKGWVAAIKTACF